MNQKNVNFLELDYILRTFGYEKRNPSGGSSHYTYFKSGNPSIMTVPEKKPVKEFYVKKVIELLELEEWYVQNS